MHPCHHLVPARHVLVSHTPAWRWSSPIQLLDFAVVSFATPPGVTTGGSSPSNHSHSLLHTSCCPGMGIVCVTYTRHSIVSSDRPDFVHRGALAEDVASLRRITSPSLRPRRHPLSRGRKTPAQTREPDGPQESLAHPPVHGPHAGAEVRRGGLSAQQLSFRPSRIVASSIPDSPLVST